MSRGVEDDQRRRRADPDRGPTAQWRERRAPGSWWPERFRLGATGRHDAGCAQPFESDHDGSRENLRPLQRSRIHAGVSDGLGDRRVRRDRRPDG